MLKSQGGHEAIARTEHCQPSITVIGVFWNACTSVTCTEGVDSAQSRQQRVEMAMKGSRLASSRVEKAKNGSLNDVLPCSLSPFV